MSIIKQEPGTADFHRGVPGTEISTLDRPGEILITSLPANGILPSIWEIHTPENHAKAVKKPNRKRLSSLTLPRIFSYLHEQMLHIPYSQLKPLVHLQILQQLLYSQIYK